MSTALKNYLSLTKPRILSMVLVTTALGYFLSAYGIPSRINLTITLIGTALSSAGAAVLNCFLERDIDARMDRTAHRPLVVGSIPAPHALSFGILLVLSGTVLLVTQINLLTGFLALLTAFLYVLVYTPLKRVTWLNTSIGAIPGALPPMGGWAAAQGDLGWGAWALFLILFFWQHPHFFAIAWMYREDYAKGGFKMLPVVDPSGQSTFRQILVFSMLLLMASLLPTALNLSGYYYLGGALLMGSALLLVGIKLKRSHSMMDARRLLRASVLYLPLLFALIILDAKF